MKPPQGWSSQDERVLADAEREAERFASYARLTFSLSIPTLMLVLSIAVDRWSSWVALIAGASIALSSTGAPLTQANVFSRFLSWIGIYADVLLGCRRHRSGRYRQDVSRRRSDRGKTAPFTGLNPLFTNEPSTVDNPRLVIM